MRSFGCQDRVKNQAHRKKRSEAARERPVKPPEGAQGSQDRPPGPGTCHGGQPVPVMPRAQDLSYMEIYIFFFSVLGSILSDKPPVGIRERGDIYDDIYDDVF